MKKFFTITFTLLISFIFLGTFKEKITEAMAVITSVTPVNIMGSGAQITWMTDTPSDSRVYFGTTMGSYTLSSTMRCDNGGNVTSHCVNLTSLSPNTVYYYRVESMDSLSEIAVSSGYQFTSASGSGYNSSSSVASGGGGGGSYPTSPSNLYPSLSYPNSVNISWVDNSSDETRFDLYRRMTGGSWSFLTSRSSGYLTYYDTGLAGGTYEYGISACNTYGCSTMVYGSSSITVTSTTAGTSSSSISYNSSSSIASGGGGGGGGTDTVTTSPSGSIPGSPSNIEVKFISPDYTYISWVDNSFNETRFDIYRRSSNTPWSLISSKSAGYTSHYESGLSEDIYSYYIMACNSYGCSPSVYSSPVTVSYAVTTTSAYSSFGTVTTTANVSGGTPTSPSSVYASLTYPNSVNISWTDSSPNETRFDLYRRMTGGSWSFLTSRSSGYLTYYDTGLAPGSYKYAVSACNNYGCSSAVYNTVTINITATTVSSIGSDSTTGIFTSPYSAITSNSSSLSNMTPATISGSVLNSLGQPVAGSYIYISPKTTTYYSSTTQSYSATTNDVGLFSLSLPPGAYSVEAFSPSGKNYLKPPLVNITLQSGDVRNLIISYPSGTKTLSGIATFPDGSPVADAEVGAYRKESGQWVSAFTDLSGKYEVNLSGGTWEISIRPRSSSVVKWSVPLPYPTFVFSNDSLIESKTVNFSVSAEESPVIIRVLDSAGNPVSEIGVVVDNVSVLNAFSASSGMARQMKYAMTGADGIARLYNPADTFYVRVYAPAKSMFSALPEEKIRIDAGTTKNLLITLRKESEDTVIKIEGSTKMEDGALTNAFVWAWSEKGGNKQTTSTAFGDFSLKLAKGQKWHIGAGKDSSSSLYKSTELVIDTSVAIPSLNLILSKYGMETAQIPATVSMKATEQVVVSGNDGSRVSLPPSSVQDKGTISVEIKPTIEVPSQAASAVVSRVYDIKVANSSGENISKLSSDAEITIPYDEAELKDKGVLIENVVPSYFDEKSGTWVAVSNYTIDKARKVVVMRVNHLTRFALIAAADTTPPGSPSNITASITNIAQDKSINKVRISWVNPLKDTDHSKIYRSDEIGKIGNVVATVVITDSFMDQPDSIAGKTYYYTVRSVDSAGNESTNTSQVSVTLAGTLSGLASSKKQTTLLLPPGQVLSGAITRNLRIGISGDDVKTLQKILISENVYEQSIISGYFGQLTKEAVVAFQEKYSDEILAPSGFTKGTGYVGGATRKKLNEILSKQKSPSESSSSEQKVAVAITGDLTLGSIGDEVKVLQTVLVSEGISSSTLITGNFDAETEKAVKILQEKYASEILKPVGLAKGSGFVGKATRKKVNEILSK